MKRGRAVPRNPAAGQTRSAWTFVRRWVAIYTLSANLLARIAPSTLRRFWLRAIGGDLAKLEQILRSLLLLMRAPSAPSKAIMFTPDRKSGARSRRRLRPRFSLTLRKFSWAPALCLPSTSNAKPAPRLPGAPVDPADALTRRLDAMRAVFADPARFAARISAAIGAHGLRLSAAKSRIPAADLWRLINALPATFDAPSPAANFDTS